MKTGLTSQRVGGSPRGQRRVLVAMMDRCNGMLTTRGKVSIRMKQFGRRSVMQVVGRGRVVLVLSTDRPCTTVISRATQDTYGRTNVSCMQFRHPRVSLPCCSGLCRTGSRFRTTNVTKGLKGDILLAAKSGALSTFIRSRTLGKGGV